MDDVDDLNILKCQVGCMGKGRHNSVYLSTIFSTLRQDLTCHHFGLSSFVKQTIPDRCNSMWKIMSPQFIH